MSDIDWKARAEAAERTLAEYRKSLDLTEEALRAAERERDELARKVFVPGLHRCAKCDLRLSTTNFHVSDGSMSANREPQDCPNGCGPMWPVTEREAGNKLIDDMDIMVDRLKAAELQLSKAEAQMKGMREALREIVGLHVGDQPMDSAYSEAEWAQRVVGQMRRIAQAALNIQEAGDGD